MINGLGQNGGIDLMPLFDNFALTFDFGQALAEAAARRDSTRLSQSSQDERNDGLGLREQPTRHDDRQTALRSHRETRSDKTTDRSRRTERGGRPEDTTRRTSKAEGHRAKMKSSSSTDGKGHLPSNPGNQAAKGVLGGQKALQNLGSQMNLLRAEKFSADSMGLAREGDLSAFAEKGNAQKGHQAGSQGRTVHGRGLLHGAEPNFAEQAADRATAKAALRAMNPNSLEAQLKGAKTEGEKTVQRDTAKEFEIQAALDVQGVQASQSLSQGPTDVSQSVVEAAKQVVKGMQPKAVSAQSSASAAAGLADLRGEAEAGTSRGEAAKAKPTQSETQARFENAMRAMETGETIVKMVDAKLGNIEARIMLNGQDLTVRLMADESASRQGLIDVLAEIRRELKEAQLVTGEVDVSHQRERGLGEDAGGRESSASREREENEREKDHIGFSLMV